MQQVALAQSHNWTDSQIYACGNSAMINQVRETCLAAGAQAHRFVAEAFVPSGALTQASSLNTLHPVLEKVGPRYSLDGMLAAREQTVRALAAIVDQLKVGMTTAQALQMASQTLIAVVDLGPVWDGDYGDTFVFGEHPLHDACVKALHEVFDETRDAWHRGLTGRELYDFAERSALCKGWRLERNLAGHRIADFPHALFGQDKLAEIEIVPSEMVWVLEIRLCHPTQPIGAFFEDILIGEANAVQSGAGEPADALHDSRPSVAQTSGVGVPNPGTKVTSNTAQQMPRSAADALQPSPAMALRQFSKKWHSPCFTLKII